VLLSKKKLIAFMVLSLTLIVFSTSLLVIASSYPQVEYLTIPLFEYSHKGVYDYKAQLKPNILYGSTVIGPGEGTLYTRILKYVNFTFNYHFNIEKNSSIILRYSFKTILSSPKGWSKILSSTPNVTERFIGKVAEISTKFKLNLTEIKVLLSDVSDETGSFSDRYYIEYIPRINVLASNDEGLVDSFFTPKLTLTLVESSSQGSRLDMSDLYQYDNQSVTKTISITHGDVYWKLLSSYILLGVGVGGFSLSTYLTYTNSSKYEKKKLNDLLGSIKEYVVEVEDFPRISRPMSIYSVKNLKNFVKMAELIEKPILLKRDEQRYVLRLIDNNMIYQLELSKT